MEIRKKISELIIPKFNDLLIDILEHKHTHYTLYGGRGSTKSSFVPVATLLLLLQNNDMHAISFRKVKDTLRESVYNQFLFAISLLGIEELFRTTRNPLEIMLKRTGQKILFRGVDEPHKIKSIKAPFGYFGITHFEELDQYSDRDEIRNILQSTMRGGSKFWNFETFNPPITASNWANKDLLEDRSGRVVVKSSYLDVPPLWLGEPFFDEAEHLKATNERAYRHEYLGEVTGTGGNVFDNVTERIITDEEYKRFDNLKFGVDFGFNIDPFTWVKLHYDKMRRILYLLDEIYEVKLSNRKAVEKIKQKQNGRMLITADSEDPRTINEFSMLGLNITGAVKGPDSRDYGFKFLQDLGEIVIDKRRTPNAYKEFISYEYSRNRNGEFISEYPKKNDHALDAVRYALESEMRQSKIYTSNHFKI